jgi:hypothetical protein
MNIIYRKLPDFFFTHVFVTIFLSIFALKKKIA